jgi:hypothetical protein
MKRSALMSAVLMGVLLVAASEAAETTRAQSPPTIFARPLVLDWAQPAQLYGSAPGASRDDVVTIEVRECGSSFFRTFVEVHASAGGGWFAEVGSLVTATYRAVFGGRASRSLTIRQRARIVLERRRSGRGFLVAVVGKRSFWRRPVVIQRRRVGGWETLRRVGLVDSPASPGTVSASQATFRLSVPRGTVVRAVLPAVQAGPCYVESFSRAIRA